jgi:hypothetical protein
MRLAVLILEFSVFFKSLFSTEYEQCNLLIVLCSLVGNKDGSLLPVYFQGQMSSDCLQDLIWTCKGKAVCSSGWLFFFTDLKISLNNFIPVHLTVISPHHRRLCFNFWTFVSSNCDIFHLFGTDKGRCKTTLAQNAHSKKKQQQKTNIRKPPKINKTKQNKTNLVKPQKHLSIGLWPWRGWWVLNQQETESSFLQTRFTTYNKSFTKHCGPTYNICWNYFLKHSIPLSWTHLYRELQVFAL